MSGPRPNRLWFTAAAALISLYFLGLVHGALSLYFDPDDTMNLYRSWSHPLGSLVKANLLFFLESDFYRPMGSVWYRVIFSVAGFHALPFHAAGILILLTNVFLTYAVASNLSTSREVGAVAALIGSYAPRMDYLYFDTGFIFDVLCYLFYFSALALYLRIREQGKTLGAIQLAGLCVLFVCALNSKEIAITLPAVLLLYELLYHRQTKSWIGVLLTGGISALFVLGRIFGKSDLLHNAAYRPVFTWTRFMETSRGFMGDLTGLDESFAAWWVLAIWAVMFAIAWLSRSKGMKLAWFFLMISPLPISFIQPRGAAQYYIPWFGWVLYAAIALVGLTGFLGPFRGAALLAVLALVLFPVYQRIGWANITSVTEEAPEYRRIVTELHRAVPRLARGSRLLFLNDPVPADWENLIFLVRLSYGDDSLEVGRDKKMKLAPGGPPPYLRRYDYVLDYADGLFTVKEVAVKVQ